jgi:hypothetical protein
MIIRDDLEALPGGQTRSTLRSRILLGVLVDAEIDRLGLGATPQQLDATTAWFRRRFDMIRRCDVEEFLAFAGLDVAALTAQMRTYAHIHLMQTHHAAEVARRMPSYRALLRLDDWHAESEGR